jgi:hypothetical protein
MYKFLQARVMLILTMFTVNNSYSATLSFSHKERGDFIESLCLIHNKKLSESIKKDLVDVTVIFTQEEIIHFITQAALINDEELFSRESIARAYREVYLAKITASLKAQTGNQSINVIKNGAIIAFVSLAAAGGAYYCYSYYPELITGKKNTQNNWWYTYFLQKPYNGIKAVVTYPGYLCGY